MKLILSSCDFRNDNSRKVILHNLPLPIDKCRLLFIPNEKATFEAIHSDKFVLRMMSFGFARENITIFDYYNAGEYVNLNIDVLYISGGNTFATLKRLRECDFDKCIVKYIHSGVTYIGGSAGAHIVSQNIAHLVGIDELPKDMTDFDGLGLFDGILICHYRDERNELFESLKADGKYKLYALTYDDSMVVAKDDVIAHYDTLIDEHNDPVHDPKPLRDYMDKWDGQAFIDEMQLDMRKSVLEIGVGAGRLAVRVAPFCGRFVGIDISPKTIKRAKENLKGQENTTLICDDFLAHDFEDQKYDVIYSSLNHTGSEHNRLLSMLFGVFRRVRLAISAYCFVVRTEIHPKIIRQ